MVFELCMYSSGWYLSCVFVCIAVGVGYLRCVCIAAVGVGAGRQKGWDGLDGGGEITKFGGERLKFWGNVLGKQVRASSLLLPALCPKLLLLLETTRLKLTLPKKKYFDGCTLFNAHSLSPDWSSQLWELTLRLSLASHNYIRMQKNWMLYPSEVRWSRFVSPKNAVFGHFL